MLFLSIFIFLLHPSLHAEEISLTIDEALVIALRDNRDILLKIEDIKKAKVKVAEAKGALFPSLTFTGSWTETRGLYAKDISQTTTQTTLKQYLYKGGKTINTIQQNKADLEVANTLLDKTRLEVVLNVKKAFYTLLLSSEFADLNKGILDNTREHLEYFEARYKDGQASQSDILEIESSLNTVYEAYVTSLNQIESTQALLKNLLYLDENISIRPEAKFIFEPKEIAFEEGFLQAMKSRPEIRQYEAQGQSDKKAIEIAKADNRPNIYASWDYYSRSRTSLTFSPTKGWQDYNIIGFTFTWPIFDGWQTRHKVEQAIVDLKETQLTNEKTIKDIAQEVKDAYLEFKDALIKIKSTESQVNLYKDTFKVAQDKYKKGQFSSLELNDASLGYKVALFNQGQAIYDYVIAKAKFDKATGRI